MRILPFPCRWYLWRSKYPKVKETVDATLNRISSSGVSGASYFTGSIIGTTRWDFMCSRLNVIVCYCVRIWYEEIDRSHDSHV